MSIYKVFLVVLGVGALCDGLAVTSEDEGWSVVGRKIDRAKKRIWPPVEQASKDHQRENPIYVESDDEDLSPHGSLVDPTLDDQRVMARQASPPSSLEDHTLDDQRMLTRQSTPFGFEGVSILTLTRQPTPLGFDASSRSSPLNDKDQSFLMRSPCRSPTLEVDKVVDDTPRVVMHLNASNVNQLDFAISSLYITGIFVETSLAHLSADGIARVTEFLKALHFEELREVILAYQGEHDKFIGILADLLPDEASLQSIAIIESRLEGAIEEGFLKLISKNKRPLNITFLYKNPRLQDTGILMAQLSPDDARKINKIEQIQGPIDPKMFFFLGPLLERFQGVPEEALLPV